MSVKQSDDLSPEGINRAHGKATWTCWNCKAEIDLHWHFGLSVAVCSKPECANAYNEMCANQIAEQQAFEEHLKDYFG